jgi:acetyl-CoA carboxylase carboxyltransferase component
MTIELRARATGPVAASVTDITGRRVVLASFDPAVHRGAITPDAGATLEAAARAALDARLPLVVDVSSSGADVGEGLAATHGWGRAARAITECSGVVPLLFAATGPAVSGPALLLGLADQVVMSADAYAFVNGPVMVRQFTGIDVERDELGGADAHARWSGVASLVTADRETARDGIGALLAYLPDSVDDLPAPIDTDDTPDRATPEAGALIPASPTGSYDVRDVIRSVVDDGVLLELRGRWARNLVTGLASIGGDPVGVVANQPLAIAGTLDIAASQKGARFVSFCDAFNLPIVTFVDTPGFYPGKDLEWRGMIRHGAQLAFAYARATVPRVCVTLRKSYGGAYIVMDSKYMGSDLSIAWPTAEIAVMGARAALEILHRRASPEERAGREREYEERLLNPYVAAERGSVDMVIDPADTRREVAHALAALRSKAERLVARRHDNSPL